MRLSAGQSAEVTTAFIELLGAHRSRQPQRCTCLDVGRRYLYESRASGFRREIEIDRDGLVVTYPDFWQRG
ncbi:putative glycolipid-binding domain-containing protein [Mesorhizobium huakuii]|uniref:Glycolipid-binding domain-containing protein n=1 Tax=Mesorhizobium huakuii TaxID=28104 RepID=A0ABZ0VTN8_9HYPH|nr:putative glycolipid-binding domain-containing protein [Mesorhizobium huakuii]WQB98926.1 putative glycolipid-binding domain-containing protein [Mesorhizobium huakuii]